MFEPGRPVPQSVTHPADLDLAFHAGPDGTWLKRRRASYPYALTGIYPPDRRGLTVMPQSVSGGLFGGEDLVERAHVGPGAMASIHDQGARTCHAHRGRGPARLLRVLHCEQGGHLDWYGQPSVLLPGADIDLQTEIVVSGNARVLCSDIFGYHVPDAGDAHPAHFHAHLMIRREGVGIIAENAADVILSPELPDWFATLILVCDDPDRISGALSFVDAQPTPDGVLLGADLLPGGAGLVVMATSDHAGILTAHIHGLQTAIT
ncbi:MULTISPECIES: urease accessory protein UreD [unclassified Minwuia]|uniref:urease accessory protein UreD n=1 Tax=unclassified Minwuia TaxID=2618799 RepID=UPI0024791372|nr:MULTISPECIES: urease accessory protein UreD [unclassified Minwuia]